MLTEYVPATALSHVNLPVAASNFAPSGKFAALNVIFSAPVTVAVNETACPGVVSMLV